MQVDKCEALTISYSSAAHFDRVMHTGPRAFSLKFDDAPQLDVTLELDALRVANGDATIDEETDQFITRRLTAEAPSLTTELVVAKLSARPAPSRGASSRRAAEHCASTPA